MPAFDRGIVVQIIRGPGEPGPARPRANGQNRTEPDRTMDQEEKTMVSGNRPRSAAVLMVIAALASGSARAQEQGVYPAKSVEVIVDCWE